MAHIDGEIFINRPVDEVFDFVADERNEPRHNPQIVSVEQTSTGAIGSGTVFRAESKMIGLTVETTITFTVFERPRLLALSSQSVVRLIRPLPTADIQGTLTFDPVPQGTRMRWSWELQPRGVLKWMASMVARMGERQERSIWAEPKRVLEAQGTNSRP